MGLFSNWFVLGHLEQRFREVKNTMACRNNRWYSKRNMGESMDRRAC